MWAVLENTRWPERGSLRTGHSPQEAGLQFGCAFMLPNKKSRESNLSTPKSHVNKPFFYAPHGNIMVTLSNIMEHNSQERPVHMRGIYVTSDNINTNLPHIFPMPSSRAIAVPSFTNGGNP